MKRIEPAAILAVPKPGGEGHARDARPAWLRELQRAQQLASAAKSSKVGGLVARPAEEGPQADPGARAPMQPPAGKHSLATRGVATSATAAPNPASAREQQATGVGDPREAQGTSGVSMPTIAASSATPPQPGGVPVEPSLSDGRIGSATPLAPGGANELAKEAPQPASAARSRAYAVATERYAQRLMHAHAEGSDVQVWIRDAALEGHTLGAVASGVAAALSQDGKRLTALMINGRTVYKQGR